MFDNVEGLEKGSKIYFKGVEIGNVSNIDLYQDKVSVGILYNDKANIPFGSKFTIKNSLTSSASIYIDPTNSNEYLTQKDTVVGKYYEEGFIENLSSDSTQNRKLKSSVNKIVQGIKEIVAHDHDLMSKAK